MTGCICSPAPRTATRLTPRHGRFRAQHGLILTYAGDPAAGLAEIDTALTQNPHAPFAYHLWRARALYSLGEMQEVLAEAFPGLSIMPDHTNAMRLLAACAGASGNAAIAEQTVQEVRSIAPNFSVVVLNRTAP